MFGGQFGHTRFSLTGSSNLEIDISVKFFDSLKNVSGFGIITNIEQNFFDGMDGSFTATPGIPTTFYSVENMACVASAVMGIPVEATMEDHLGAISSLAVDSAISCEMEDGLQATVRVGKDMKLADVMSAFDSLSVHGELSKNILFSQFFTDLLSCSVSTAILDNITVNISTEVPAGSTLEIDSNTFDVLLDGKNILDLHDGGWFFLDRNVVQISVDSGTGGKLDGKVLYKERYL